MPKLSASATLDWRAAERWRLALTLRHTGDFGGRSVGGFVIVGVDGVDRSRCRVSNDEDAVGREGEIFRRVVAAVTLDDKYSLDSGRVFLTGTQALVRLMLMQRALDDMFKEANDKLKQRDE